LSTRVMNGNGEAAYAGLDPLTGAGCVEMDRKRPGGHRFKEASAKIC
jgi:hypothetical protein